MDIYNLVKSQPAIMQIIYQVTIEREKGNTHLIQLIGYPFCPRSFIGPKCEPVETVMRFLTFGTSNLQAPYNLLQFSI